MENIGFLKFENLRFQIGTSRDDSLRFQIGTLENQALKDLGKKWFAFSKMDSGVGKMLNLLKQL
jgi:hypothetical protein